MAKKLPRLRAHDTPGQVDQHAVDQAIALSNFLQEARSNPSPWDVVKKVVTGANEATGATAALKALTAATIGMQHVREPRDLLTHERPVVEQGGMMALPFPSKIIRLPSGRILERAAKWEKGELPTASYGRFRNPTDKDIKPDEKFYGWTGGEDVSTQLTRGKMAAGAPRIVYNLKEGDKTIGSIHFQVKPHEVYVHEVYLRPEHRGPGALKDLVSMIPNWMEKDPLTGEYKRTVRASLANTGIPRILKAASRKDPALGRAGRGELDEAEQGYLAAERNKERRDTLAERQARRGRAAGGEGQPQVWNRPDVRTVQHMPNGRTLVTFHGGLSLSLDSTEYYGLQQAIRDNPGETTYRLAQAAQDAAHAPLHPDHVAVRLAELRAEANRMGVDLQGINAARRETGG